ncbi:peptidoglycan-binding protein [uncultured Hoeflea sp.]|uniref:peptidoglycan-binding domain-containing protein n=1 Tax=uncultured Hoeflea sp. TaxID=538666 RepID=UPI00261BA28B|nr:peptidoglycan-binding protein [uncultured Hoeflea sp.]
MPKQRAAPDLFDNDASGNRGVLSMLGHLISAHPSLAGGTVAFTVIFGFVTANALWQQPGQHPAPILKTRDADVGTAPAVSAAPVNETPFIKDVPPRTVTTFRIERSDETPTASIPVPNAQQVSVSPTRPANKPVTEPAKPVAKADPVLVEMQKILARNGLYGGEIDGLMGPKSAAAIRAWEKANGYVETGGPTAGLLAVMEKPAVPQARAPEAVSVPETVSASETNLTPEAIINERMARPKPKPRPEPVVAADQRAGEPVTIPAAPEAVVSELVRQIQSGLSNIAYADIAVDGVAGSQTKSAIEAFEKHYRLPVTGQPNQTVLRKLIEIGAL